MKLKRITLLYFLAIVCLLPEIACKKAETPQKESGSTNAHASQPKTPVELKVKWPPGRRILQRSEMENRTKTLVPHEVAKTQTARGTENYAYTVVGASDSGGPMLEMKVLDLQTTVMMDDKLWINMDSKRVSSDAFEDVFRRAVGARITYILDASNKVVRLEGIKEFRDNLAAGLPEEARAGISSTFSEEFFRKNANWGYDLPDKPVAPGESWSFQVEMFWEPIGNIQYDMTNSFRGWEVRDSHNCAVLETKGRVRGASPSSARVLEEKLSVENGWYMAKSWFDAEAGMYVEAIVNEEMTLALTVPKKNSRGISEQYRPTKSTIFLSKKVAWKYTLEKDGLR